MAGLALGNVILILGVLVSVILAIGGFIGGAIAR
jgi:hypothetical protein